MSSEAQGAVELMGNEGNLVPRRSGRLAGQQPGIIFSKYGGKTFADTTKFVVNLKLQSGQNEFGQGPQFVKEYVEPEAEGGVLLGDVLPTIFEMTAPLLVPLVGDEFAAYCARTGRFAFRLNLKLYQKLTTGAPRDRWSLITGNARANSVHLEQLGILPAHVQQPPPELGVSLSLTLFVSCEGKNGKEYECPWNCDLDTTLDAIFWITKQDPSSGLTGAADSYIFELWATLNVTVKEVGARPACRYLQLETDIQPDRDIRSLLANLQGFDSCQRYKDYDVSRQILDLHLKPRP